MTRLSRGKVFSPEDQDLLIEAKAPVSGGEGYRRIAFRASYIDYLFEIDDKISGITLRNGVTIPVALSFSDLKTQVYAPDFRTGGSIDLTLVTGEAASSAPSVSLSAEFNPARSGRLKEKEPLMIRAVLRKPQSNDHIIHTFSESDIARMGVEDNTRAVSGESVK